MSGLTLITSRNVLYCRSVRGLSTLRKSKRNWASYALLVLPATAFGLGIWQIQRREWKINLIKSLNERIPADPVALSQDVNSSLQLPEFTHVKVEGYFDHSREIVIGPRVLISDFLTQHDYSNPWLSGRGISKYKTIYNFGSTPPPAGYLVVTPFYLSGRCGESILVNRGWVPMDARDPSTRLAGQVKGKLELSGYVRYPEKPSIFSPDVHDLICLNEGQKPQRLYACREIPRMAVELSTLPIFLDASHQSTCQPYQPITGQTRIALRNEHATYIFTWFSLGTIGLGMWLYIMFA